MRIEPVLTAFAALLIVSSGLCQDIDVTFKSGDITLSGTLLLPAGDGPFPAVIFIHGSGPEDRQNSKTRAKAFVKNGIAALIYDKRGVGKSGGDPKFNDRYSFEVLASDAVAAANLLSTRLEIKKEKIGFVASSQGGWVAPIAATRFSVAFIIILSGSVTTVGEDNIFERNARLMQEGFSEKDVQEATAMHLVDQQVSRDGNRFDEFVELWDAYRLAPWFKRVYLGEKPIPVDHPYRRWYRTVVDFDPIPYLNQISVPILWLYGDPKLDRFCPVEMSIGALNKLSSTNYSIQVNEGADHSLKNGSKDLSIGDAVFSWIKERALK